MGTQEGFLPFLHWGYTVTFRQNWLSGPCSPCPRGACGQGAGAPLPSAPTASLAAANPKCRNSGNSGIQEKNLHFKQQFQAGPAPNHFGFPGSVFIGADPSHHRVSRNEPFFSIIVYSKMRLWHSTALRQTPIDPLCAERDIESFKE